MKIISILALESSVIEAIADPIYVFKVVNDYLEQSGKQRVFNVEVIGLGGEIKLNGNMFTVNVDKHLENVKKTDLIIIPSFDGDAKTAIEKNKLFLPWIIDQYKQGCEIASLCVGSFILASTGLLKGKKCSGHWMRSNEFKEMFPDVALIDGAIITEDHGIYSSGGANSYWNLLLYLVEKYTDRETAVYISKAFAVDINRDSQAEYIMFMGLKNHGDNEILKAQKFIEENYKEKIVVDNLASMLAIGKRSFERRFKKATKYNVVDYNQRIKVENAKRSFETTRKTISEVMFDVGYLDHKSFRLVFKKITGSAPIEYRDKYNKM
ncbi:MAG: helix-turn-helix domain-containing protein [Ferruginibacter sp.]